MLNMFRLVGNEKAWLGFVITLMTALMAKFGLGEAPDVTTLVSQAQEAIGPVLSGLATHVAVYLTTNSSR